MVLYTSTSLRLRGKLFILQLITMLNTNKMYIKLLKIAPSQPTTALKCYLSTTVLI